MMAYAQYDYLADQHNVIDTVFFYPFSFSYENRMVNNFAINNFETLQKALSKGNMGEYQK